MNKTVNINLGGSPFIIDEPAYRVLDEYLRSISQVCGAAGQPETAFDIEQRIAEILYERYAGKGIVALNDINEIICRIGEPGEILGDEEISEYLGNDPVGPVSTVVPPPIQQLKKRLYRDPRNKLLGGVCSGIGWYFGIDPVWIRLIFVGLCFLSLSTLVIAYLILWIVIPEASTPAEQLQMMGMRSSVGNVGKIVTGAVPPPFSTSDIKGGKRLASTLADIFGWIARSLFFLLAVAGILIACTLLLGLGLGLIASIVALFIPSVRSNPNPSPETIRLALGCVIGAILFIGIPLILAIRGLYHILSHNKTRMGRSLKLGLLISWLLGVVALITCGMLLNFQAPFTLLQN